MSGRLFATIERQLWSRFRSPSYLVGAIVPVVLIGALLFQTARVTESPATAMFLAILSALWIGGSTCVREIVDERKLTQREPHLSLFAYAVAKIVHAAILAVGQSLILMAFMRASDVVGLHPAPLWATLFLTTLAGSTLALLLSSVCDEASTALAWFPLVLVPQVVFGGFLFPYDTTRPFTIVRETGQIVVMPEPLVRQPVRHWSLRAAGTICVARWALEAYAAQTFERDLSVQARLDEAVKVSFFVPLTLSDAPVAQTLITYAGDRARDPSRASPRIDAAGGRYLALLAAFAAGQALLLIVILPWRDPRRS